MIDMTLSFDDYQGKYIKSLPLHESQQTISDSENELQIKLKLYITHDFIMELLSYGETLAVIKSERLKEEMKNTLQKALDNYE
jgi:predicted DNA-binding transcriptional regulator YafY